MPSYDDDDDDREEEDMMDGGDENENEEEEGEEELPQQVMDLADAHVPTSMKGIRACKRCGLLKTVDQFINEGCENCPFLEMVRLVGYRARYITR
jgi:hypothetical protein